MAKMYNLGVTHDRVFKFFTEEYDAWLRNAGINYYFVDQKKNTVDEQLKTLVTASLGDGELDRYPNLEAVIVPFAAINQLDLATLLAKGISVFNTSAHAQFVAERALSLTLAVMGNIVTSHKQLEQGNWADRVNGQGGTGKKWTTLYDRKVAIYGYGRAGEELNKLLKPFRSEVAVLNYKNRQFDDVKSVNTLSELADWCDVFVICASLNDTTENSIDQAVFSKLKNKVLINIGRGPIINEDALFTSLSNDELSGFGSDVWYNYPTEEIANCKPSKYPLENFSQVVMTPHNAGTEERADHIKYIDVAEQIVQIAKGDFSRRIR